MFSLLYYLHILPYPRPFVKHYFQKFFRFKQMVREDPLRPFGAPLPEGAANCYGAPFEFPLDTENILYHIRA